MILIKQHNSHQVAHFYEHLFCITIDDFFYDNKLFPYLDYDVTGHTIHGLVYIEINLYTKKAKQLAEKLHDLKIAIDDHVLNIVLIQLGSELKQTLGLQEPLNHGKKVLAEELHVLNAQPWKTIDGIDAIDPRKTELVPGGLFILKEKKEISTKKIEISYEINNDFAKEHKELLPLFTQIANLTGTNIAAALNCQLGFYPDGTDYTPEHHVRKVLYSSRLAKSVEFDVKHVLEVAKATLGDLSKEKAFTRLANELNQVAIANPEHVFPDPYTMYKRTDIVIGAKGWQRIATDENCKLLLSHMEVCVTMEKEKASIKVKPLT